jgi:hypothetical protein
VSSATAEAAVKEKRKSKRNPLIIGVEIRKNNQKILCASVDVSKTGLGVFSDHDLELGYYTVIIADKKLEGRIVHKTHKGNGITLPEKQMYRYGIEWSNALHDEILKSLLIRKYM